MVFFGSGEFAIPALERIVDVDRRDDGWRARVRLAAVVTRPDRPAGRGRKTRPTPLREAGSRLGVDVVAPETVNDIAFLDGLVVDVDRRRVADLFVVADYGEFLRKPFRDYPRIGAFNLHGSLLPRHRGAAPVAYAVLGGDEVTGVTLFRIERELDSGPIVARSRVSIEERETAGELEARLAVVAADLLEETLPAFVDGSYLETAQDESEVTLAPKLAKSQGEIDWRESAGAVVRLVRAMNPWPIAYSSLEPGGGSGGGGIGGTGTGGGGDGGERIRILRARVSALDSDGGDGEGAERRSGTVVRASGGRLVVACGEGAVEILELQRAGKAALSVEAFLRGRALSPGDRFAECRDRPI